MPSLRILALLVPLLAALAAAPARAAEERVAPGGLAAVAWTPGDAARGAPAPVVVFSHGLGLCPTQARFLATALADAGYLVVAPYHADSACELALDLVNPARVPLKPPLLWTEADYRDRGEDVARLVAALPGDARLGGLADATRVALVGHSLGGYTVLALAGAWPSWPPIPGLRAVVAQAAYVQPLASRGRLEALRAPVMFQVATGDPAFTLPAAGSDGAYARAPSPKMLVEFRYGTHFAWTDAALVGRAPIVDATLAFLDRHVRDLPERPALVAAGDGVARLLREPAAPLARAAPPTLAEETWAALRGVWRRTLDLWPWGDVSGR